MTATPGLTINAHSGYNEVIFANSDTPTANYLDRTLNGVTVRLTRTLGVDGTFLDYTPAAAKLYSYSGVAVDGSGNESTPSSALTSTVSVAGCSLFQVTKSATTNKTGTYLELFNQEGQKRPYQREGNVLLMPGRVKPVIKTSPIIGRFVEIPIIIPGGYSSMLSTLEEFLDSNDVFCFRESYGDVMFGTFPPQRLELGFNNEGTILLVETDYSEGVIAA